MTLVHLSAPVELKVTSTSHSVRRVFDFTIAAAGLLCLSPVMLLIILAIWIDGGRPIFFSQVRLGQGGRVFSIYKFRKFHEQCGPAASLVTVNNDPRFTRLGRILGRMKLDELPQLWNILTGDMAIVGPRPETFELASCFSGPYLRILDYRPGIFGPNQVLFRNECYLYPDNCDPEQFYRDVLFPFKANTDLEYFSSRTFVSDIGWIIRGILAVFDWRSLPDERLEGRLAKGWIGQNRQQTLARSTSGTAD